MSGTYILRKGVSTLSDLKDGAYIESETKGAKNIYYVDGNAGDDSNSGLSWEESLKTLAVGLAASHTDIASGARGWAARNVIYCKGDALDEDLVLLAQKTDVIGVGHWDRHPYCGLIGNHIPTGAANSGLGTRFFNMYFRANSAGGDIWTLDSTVGGLEFHNCWFDAGSTTAATGAIVSTASTHLGIFNNKFTRKYSDAVIEFGTGDARGSHIVGNYIEGANAGIELGAGTTDSSGASEEFILVADNYISTATECINDAASIARIVNNVCVTLQAKGASGAGAIVGQEFLSGGNKISASDLANADWPALGAL